MGKWTKGALLVAFGAAAGIWVQRNHLVPPGIPQDARSAGAVLDKAARALERDATAAYRRADAFIEQKGPQDAKDLGEFLGLEKNVEKAGRLVR